MMRSLFFGLVGVAVGAAAMWAYGDKFKASDATDAAPPAGEKPAYLIVLGDVYDREAFMEGYAAKLGPSYAEYGGEYLALGRNKRVLEGDHEFESFAISKWPSMEAAQQFWDSEEYAPLKQARIENEWGRFDVYLIEGLPEE